MQPESIEFAASDGYTLRGTLWPPAGQTHAAMLVHPATAVPERLYAGFAQYAASRGFAALTYSYRGVDGSRPADLRALDARMRDWADYDVEAATVWARRRFPQLPLVAVGHSFGGHAIGLCDATRHLRAGVLVASHAGSTRLIRSRLERLRVRTVLGAIAPVACALCGYAPCRRLRLGEDLPAGVMREWAGWTTLPRYFFDDPTLDAAARFARASLPILALGIDDDPWATPAAIDLLIGFLTHARIERRQIDPRATGCGPIGHMGFFRSAPGKVLWPGVVDWLASTLSAAPDAADDAAPSPSLAGHAG
ncbi:MULTISPECIES: alpha/beta fold hydrolase [Burkholderia]|uniref:alpha/beta hydrolase family protein n=1 Tax=Burkholderia TaxID=32008 RepID=UPI000841F8E9|nr:MULTISPECIES: alpha/beta fold hydrolase [unclassified Burkholderia]AOK31072.1 alpha/beta hydrolase [Burkholderia sp. Bp7605]